MWRSVQHGLPDDALRSVFQAIVINRLSYLQLGGDLPPERTTAVSDKNFIIRMLYKDLYSMINSILYIFTTVRLSAAVCHFYRAMHFSANARSWDRMSSVCPSVRLSVCL